MQISTFRVFKFFKFDKYHVRFFVYFYVTNLNLYISTWGSEWSFILTDGEGCFSEFFCVYSVYTIFWIIPVGDSFVAMSSTEPVKPCHLSCNFVSRRLATLNSTDSRTHPRGSHRAWRQGWRHT